ncbi:hypothetical protein [Saccharothrix violaceirubra]|uniref:Uncharacterized protein n=1 Tax=Saccharothrix violaceirubra TaxID=413306 RepID=A0A7W7T8N8_9PSEU|nr:hypothetical protein [Saccharothrix violaceirubra]MBB4968381.1 hypothetical protein [Saccharothrix violaceirubra]
MSADRLRRGGIGGFFSKQWFEIGIEVPDEEQATAEAKPPRPRREADSVDALIDLADNADRARMRGGTRPDPFTTPRHARRDPSTATWREPESTPTLPRTRRESPVEPRTLREPPVEPRTLREPSPVDELVDAVVDEPEERPRASVIRSGEAEVRPAFQDLLAAHGVPAQEDTEDDETVLATRRETPKTSDQATLEGVIPEPDTPVRADPSANGASRTVPTPDPVATSPQEPVVETVRAESPVYEVYDFTSTSDVQAPVDEDSPVEAGSEPMSAGGPESPVGTTSEPDSMPEAPSAVGPVAAESGLSGGVAEPGATGLVAEVDAVEPAAGWSAAVGPTAVEPTAIEPTAVEPTAVEPAVSESTASEPVAAVSVDTEAATGALSAPGPGAPESMAAEPVAEFTVDDSATSGSSPTRPGAGEPAAGPTAAVEPAATAYSPPESITAGQTGVGPAAVGSTAADPIAAGQITADPAAAGSIAAGSVEAVGSGAMGRIDVETSAIGAAEPVADGPAAGPVVIRPVAAESGAVGITGVGPTGVESVGTESIATGVAGGGPEAVGSAATGVVGSAVVDTAAESGPVVPAATGHTAVPPAAESGAVESGAAGPVGADPGAASVVGGEFSESYESAGWPGTSSASDPRPAVGGQGAEPAAASVGEPIFQGYEWEPGSASAAGPIVGEPAPETVAASWLAEVEAGIAGGAMWSESTPVEPAAWGVTESGVFEPAAGGPGQWEPAGGPSVPRPWSGLAAGVPDPIVTEREFGVPSGTRAASGQEFAGQEFVEREPVAGPWSDVESTALSVGYPAGEPEVSDVGESVVRQQFYGAPAPRSAEATGGVPPVVRQPADVSRYADARYADAQYAEAQYAEPQYVGALGDRAGFVPSSGMTASSQHGGPQMAVPSPYIGERTYSPEHGGEPYDPAAAYRLAGEAMAASAGIGGPGTAQAGAGAVGSVARPAPEAASYVAAGPAPQWAAGSQTGAASAPEQMSSGGSGMGFAGMPGLRPSAPGAQEYAAGMPYGGEPQQAEPAVGLGMTAGAMGGAATAPGGESYIPEARVREPLVADIPQDAGGRLRRAPRVALGQLVRAMPGQVVVIIGTSGHTVDVAHWAARKLRVGTDRVFVAGPVALTAGQSRICGPEHAAMLATELHRSPLPAVVAIEIAGSEPDDAEWARDITQALRVDASIAVVDPTRSLVALRRHIAELGKVDAVAVRGPHVDDETIDELALPVLLVEGKPAENS